MSMQTTEALKNVGSGGPCLRFTFHPRYVYKLSNACRNKHKIDIVKAGYDWVVTNIYSPSSSSPPSSFLAAAAARLRLMRPGWPP
jgi:hypothetical protein